MKRVILFEDFSTKNRPRFTEEEIEEAIKKCDFDSFFSINLDKVTIDTWTKSFETEPAKRDPGYMKTQFEFYVNDYGVECDIEGFKQELKKSLLAIKKESPDDENLLSDLGKVGFSNKYFTLEEILESIKEKDLIDQISPQDKDYVLDSMIDDPKSNPVEVWTKPKQFVGDLKFDKFEFSDSLIDGLTR